MKLEKFIAELSEVDEKFRPLYEKDEKGGFNLALENEDVTGLKDKNFKLIEEKKSLIKLQTDFKIEQERLNTKILKMQDDNKQRSESELLEKGKFDEVLATRQKEFKTEIDAKSEENKALSSLIGSSLIGAQVSVMSAELFGPAADILKHNLSDRYEVVRDGNDFTLQINDVNGHASKMTKEQLMDEFRSNEQFKPFIIGRKSSGGGSDSGGGTGDGSGDTAKYFDRTNKEYDIGKQVELQKTDPVAYDQMVKKYNLNDPLAAFYKN